MTPARRTSRRSTPTYCSSAMTSSITSTVLSRAPTARIFFFFSSRRRHTRYWRDWSSDVCSSDLGEQCRQHVLAVEEDAAHPSEVVEPYVVEVQAGGVAPDRPRYPTTQVRRRVARSEERRVGEECRTRWSPDH